jgi:predicted MPP superfamily phosphohydrolase
MNILHITDLHFGRDPSEGASDERQLALDRLLNTIEGLDEPWIPTVICLSGDVAFSGRMEEYELAAAWLKRLLSILHLSPANLVICPGNHDIERTFARTYARPPSSEEADQCLGTPIAEQYLRAFANFSGFCDKLGMPKYSLGEVDGYLTGYRCIDGVRFVSLNSSWF